MVIDDADWPRFGWTADLRPALAAARARGATVALATVVQLEGSAPRPVGTQMLFEDSRALGHFSGGCLEADVARHAASVIASGKPELLIYGNGSPWMDIRLTCGGRMDIFVERIAHDDPVMAELLEAMAERRPATYVSNGRYRHILDDANGAAHWDVSSASIAVPYQPQPRLFVAGGDPTALAIATLGEQAGWQAEVLRPDHVKRDGKLAFVSGLDACLGRLADADRWTAIAVATHDSELDHSLLSTALRSTAFYVGVLGARARLPGRLDRLRQAGVDTTRLHAPIGLVPTGKAPWEVAVAAIADIMAAHQARPSQ